MYKKLGGSAPPLWGGGAGSLSNTKSPGPRPSSITSDILIHAAISRNRYGPKIGECAPLGRGSWVPIEHSVARAEAYPHAKFYLDPSNRLATVHERHRQTDRQADNGPIA